MHFGAFLPGTEGCHVPKASQVLGQDNQHFASRGARGLCSIVAQSGHDGKGPTVSGPELSHECRFGQTAREWSTRYSREEATGVWIPAPAYARAGSVQLSQHTNDGRKVERTESDFRRLSWPTDRTIALEFLKLH